MNVMVIVAMTAVVTAGVQFAVFDDSLVLPEPLPGSYADKQRSAYVNQTGTMPGWEYFGTSARFKYAFTRPGSYYSARFPMHPGFYDPRVVIYQSRSFSQPYGPYLPVIPAHPAGSIHLGQRGDIR